MGSFVSIVSNFQSRESLVARNIFLRRGFKISRFVISPISLNSEFGKIIFNKCGTTFPFWHNVLQCTQIYSKSLGYGSISNNAELKHSWFENVFYVDLAIAFWWQGASSTGSTRKEETIENVNKSTKSLPPVVNNICQAILWRSLEIWRTTCLLAKYLLFYLAGSFAWWRELPKRDIWSTWARRKTVFRDNSNVRIFAWSSPNPPKSEIVQLQTEISPDSRNANKAPLFFAALISSPTRSNHEKWKWNGSK